LNAFPTSLPLIFYPFYFERNSIFSINFLSYVCFWKVIFRKLLSKLFCVCLPLEKLINEKHFLVKKKIWLGFQENIFLKNLGGKHILEVVKNL
jgi:hypothetical protein